MPTCTLANASNREFETPEKNHIYGRDFVADTSAYSSLATKSFLVKTNSVGWGMLVMNIAAEIDLTKKWSVNLPLYYSVFNYFTHRGKYRTFGTQPEFRYWFRDDKSGFFAGAHLSLFKFNYAAWGDYRYQDHNGLSPLIGAGLNGGYRKNITADGRWMLELSLGVGYAYVHYDRYVNERNGALLDSHVKHFFGIDNVGVNFVYKLNLGGGRK